jgi:hydrogenase maturation protease
MKTLFIACGNPLRGDDGVAPEVLRLMKPASGRKLRTVHQLTPELAEEMSRFDCVVFLDADVAASSVTIAPVSAIPPSPSLTHISSFTHNSKPAEIVALSRALFGFIGAALLCRIPAIHFDPGAALSPRALKFVQQAAEEIEDFL